MRNFSIKTSLRKVAVICFWLIVWEAISLYINKEIYLPSPIYTLKAFVSLLNDKETYIVLLYSSYRTLLAILISCVSGIILGFICGLNKFLYDLINPVVLVLRSTPVISIIIIAIIWIKSNYVPIFASFLMCFPIIFTSITTGIKNTNKQLLEMCTIYDIRLIDKIKYLYIHTVIPYLHSSIISVIGISWKSTAAAEVLSMPQYSVGLHLYYAKTQLEPEFLFSWTILIILLSYIFENLYKRITKHDNVK